MEISSRKNYLDKYSGHLFCPTDGCHAALVYSESRLANKNSYLKTWPNQEHTIICPYHATKIQTRPRTSGIEVGVHISDKHIANTFKYLSRKRLIAEGKIQPQQNPNSPKGGRKFLPLNTTQEQDRYSPSVDSDAFPIPSGMKEPSIRSCFCNQLLPEDVDSYIALNGDIKNVAVLHDRIIIHLDCPEKWTVDVLFFNAFRASGEQSYNLISQLRRYLKQNPDVVVECMSAGLLSKTKTGYQLQVYNPHEQRFNGKTIAQFFAKL